MLELGQIFPRRVVTMLVLMFALIRFFIAMAVMFSVFLMLIIAIANIPFVVTVVPIVISVGVLNFIADVITSAVVITGAVV